MTVFTPEQKTKLAGYSCVDWTRPGNMYRLTDCEWEELTNIALQHCNDFRGPVSESLPPWVSKQEQNLEPLEHWWRQRLKDAYKTWVRRRKAKDRPPSADGTLRSMLHGENPAEPYEIIEAEETIRQLSKLKSLKDGNALLPELERNVSRPLERAQHRQRTKPKADPTEQRPVFSDDLQTRIDRKIDALAGPGSFRTNIAPSYKINAETDALFREYNVPRPVVDAILKLTPEERRQNRAEVSLAIANIAECDQRNKDRLKSCEDKKRVSELPCPERIREVIQFGCIGEKTKEARERRAEAIKQIWLGREKLDEARVKATKERAAREAREGRRAARIAAKQAAVKTCRKGLAKRVPKRAPRPTAARLMSTAAL